MIKKELEKYHVRIAAITSSVADVYVEAVSAEDAHAIAEASCHPEDFEVQKIIEIKTIESVGTV